MRRIKMFFFFPESINEFYSVLMTLANDDLAVILSLISSRKNAMCAFLSIGQFRKELLIKTIMFSLYTSAWQDQFMHNNHKKFALLLLICNTLTVWLIAKFYRDLSNEICKSKFLNLPWERKSWDCVCVLWKLFNS